MFNLFSEKEILERVDEYTLYCFYLSAHFGIDPVVGKKYKSPIRLVLNYKEDNHCSFGIYDIRYATYRYNELMWSDQSIGKHGDIFDLVKILFKLSNRYEAMNMIAIDAGIKDGVNLRKSILDTRVKQTLGDCKISIRSKPFTLQGMHFWNSINISKQLLDAYNTTQIRYYFLYEEQSESYFPSGGTGFAYRIWDRYQLYFPYSDNRDNRFRTDFLDVCVPGFLQLQYLSRLIITKSYKDVMFLRSMGYDAISPRGENILLPAECINMMKRKYKRITVLFDNDGKHKGDEYEFEKVFVPKEMDTDKDPTDYYTNHGYRKTKLMLENILL